MESPQKNCFTKYERNVFNVQYKWALVKLNNENCTTININYWKKRTEAWPIRSEFLLCSVFSIFRQIFIFIIFIEKKKNNTNIYDYLLYSFKMVLNEIDQLNLETWGQLFQISDYEMCRTFNENIRVWCTKIGKRKSLIRMYSINIKCWLTEANGKYAFHEQQSGEWAYQNR